jgi:single-stranded-DNA-specific exonuclease
MNWELNNINTSKETLSLSKQLNVSNTIASLLVSRKIKTFEQAKKFFRPSLKDLHDPFLMKDMDKAVDRILKTMKIY